MPPKKDGKKQAVARPDNSGIPKQDVEFKFALSIETERPDLPIAVMMEWFGTTSDKLERIDTPFMDLWGKAEGGICFEKACDLIRVDDDFCKALTHNKFYLHFVNEESKVEDSLLLDYSQLLMFKGEGQPTFTFTSPTIKVMDIDSFTIKLTADKQLLQDTYRHFLNPLQVEVIGAKDVPLDPHSKYQPAFIRYSFFDGSSVQTHPVVGQGKLLWNHRHVFLAGLMDSVTLKEKLRTGFIKLELHDRDELVNKKIKEDIPLFDLTRAIEIEMENEKPMEEDPKKKGKKEAEKKEAKKEVKKEGKKKDAKLGEPMLPEKDETFQNNYGVAAFYLVDFLKPSMRTARYKAPVIPKTTFEDFESRNIDLNTTARNEMQKLISSNNYFEQDSVVLAGFTISYPIGTFQKPIPAEDPVPEDPKKNKKEPAKEAPPAQIEEEEPKPKDVFERVVYVIPYKSPELVERIESVFYQVNMAAFSLKGRREITTHLLSSEDKQSLSKDYLTGIELIDSEARVYILEGLREGAMKKLHEVMVKKSPNTRSLKILKNSSLTFLTRLYTDFSIDIKRVRFRPSLTQLLLDPSIYIKSKVAEEISHDLNKINEVKKICDDLKAVDSMNLWPIANVLMQIERKFSDSLSLEDISGVEEVQKKKNVTFNASATGPAAKTINFMASQEMQFLSLDEFSLPKIGTPQEGGQSLSNMTQSLPNVAHSLSKKAVASKTFMKDQSKQKKNYDMKLNKAEVGAEPVYIYAGQRDNWYEKQMREMREKVRNDGKAIYTYSKEYLGLSIDPHSLEEEARKENGLKDISGHKFSSLIVRTKEERMKLPKRPGDQDIEDLKNYPYYEEKAKQKSLMKNTRDMPFHSSKQEFQKYLKKNEYFSTPEVVEADKVTPVERFRMEQEEKKRAEEEAKRKMVGDSVIRIKKGYTSDKACGADRFKDIREGAPAKKGLVDVHKKDKARRHVEAYEVSFMLNEEKDNPAFNPLVRRDDPAHNIAQDEFNFYQRPEVISMSTVTKPLKKADF